MSKNYIELNSGRIIKMADVLFPSSRDRSVFMFILFDMEIATLNYDDRLALYVMLLRRIRSGMNAQETRIVFDVLREGA